MGNREYRMSQLVLFYERDAPGLAGCASLGGELALGWVAHGETLAIRESETARQTLTRQRQRERGWSIMAHALPLEEAPVQVGTSFEWGPHRLLLQEREKMEGGWVASQVGVGGVVWCEGETWYRDHGEGAEGGEERKYTEER